MNTLKFHKLLFTSYTSEIHLSIILFLLNRFSNPAAYLSRWCTLYHSIRIMLKFCSCYSCGSDKNYPTIQQCWFKNWITGKTIYSWKYLKNLFFLTEIMLVVYRGDRICFQIFFIFKNLQLHEKLRLKIIIGRKSVLDQKLFVLS